MLIPIAVLSWSQACSRFEFTSIDKILSEASKTNASDTGNGGTYDGKPIVLHHYIENFQCEGRPQPESILIRKNLTDWVIIRNTPETCAAIDQVAVSGVNFDKFLVQAKFEDKIYVAPRPYIVDPNEDPNLADIKLIDGVCEDINKKCSLSAALQTSGFVSATADTSVIVPTGTYKLTQTLAVDVSLNTIRITGDSKGLSIFDAQNSTEIMRVTGWNGNVITENIKFQNGFAASSQASAFESNLFKGQIVIKNCVFEKNNKGHTFYASAFSDVQILQSQFLNNTPDFATLYFFAINSVSMRDSLVENNSGIAGFWLASSGQTSLSIKSSSIIHNLNKGAILDNCSNCLVENTTLAENGDSGLAVHSFKPFALPQTLMNNSTIYHNAMTSGQNLEVSFQDSPSYTLIMNNSIVAVNDPTKTNCHFVAGAGLTYTILSNYNLFDDSSCQTNGAHDIIQNPKLGSLQNNGGFTPNLEPLIGSPAIDSGDNATCSALDQRSFARPIDRLGSGAICDMGAAEVQ